MVQIRVFSLNSVLVLFGITFIEHKKKTSLKEKYISIDSFYQYICIKDVTLAVNEFSLKRKEGKIQTSDLHFIRRNLMQIALCLGVAPFFLFWSIKRKKDAITASITLHIIIQNKILFTNIKDELKRRLRSGFLYPI